MEEQLSVQELASEIRVIKSSLLAIQDFLGTLNVSNNDNKGISNNRDMKFEFVEEQLQEEERVPPSMMMTKFSINTASLPKIPKITCSNANHQI